MDDTLVATTFLAPFETEINIPGPAGSLQAALGQVKNQQPIAMGVICHPHPLYGGSMNNKVVTTIVHAFHDMGLATLRFNFRGVGKSAGHYAEGIGETKDLLAILQWGDDNNPNLPIWLAGFSFGAFVAVNATIKWSVAKLLTIAPPINHFDFPDTTHMYFPWVVIQGEDDEVVPHEEVSAWVSALPNLPSLLMMKDAGHFFHGRLIELRSMIEAAMRDS